MCFLKYEYNIFKQKSFNHIDCLPRVIVSVVRLSRRNGSLISSFAVSKFVDSAFLLNTVSRIRYECTQWWIARLTGAYWIY